MLAEIERDLLEAVDQVLTAKRRYDDAKIACALAARRGTPSTELEVERGRWELMLHQSIGKLETERELLEAARALADVPWVAP